MKQNNAPRWRKAKLTFKVFLSSLLQFIVFSPLNHHLLKLSALDKNKLVLICNFYKMLPKAENCFLHKLFSLTKLEIISNTSFSLVWLHQWLLVLLRGCLKLQETRKQLFFSPSLPLASLIRFLELALVVIWRDALVRGPWKKLQKSGCGEGKSGFWKICTVNVISFA